eukprot:Em0011g631a
MSVHTEFGRSPAAELSDRPEETLIIDCADRAEEPPALKKRKSGVLTKPNDSAAKGAIHPSGPKFINSWLWKHYKLSPRSDCDKEEPAKSTSSHMKHPKDAASPATSGQGHGTLTGSGLINKHFMPVMPPFTTEEHKRAYALMVPDHATRAFIQLFRDITNAIRNSSQRLEHLKSLQKEKIDADKNIMEIINEGVREWDELPSEVYECFLSLKTGFKTRFNPSSFLLTDAALVHPGHKSLSWLEPTRREEALQQFKDELLIVAGIEGLPDPSNSPSSLDIQEDAVPNQSALDAFFDFDVSQCNLVQISTAFRCGHVLLYQEISLGVANRSARDCIEDEFKRYMLEPQTNWRVNDVMQWWSDHEANSLTLLC